MFVSTCFRDERGRIIRVAPFQREWIEAARQHQNLVIWCPPEHGKSMHFSVWLPLWALARRPNTRICIVSATASQAAKFGRVIRETIERNPVFRRVFPHLIPAHPWTDTLLTVKRDMISKDPSIQCVGVDGAILGARVDLLILDDVLTPQNTYTATQREKLFQWLQAAFFTRITANGRIIAVGVKWHPDDAYHRLVRDHGFASRCYPALDPSETTPLWPEVWPLKRLLKRKQELTAMEWRRQYLLDLSPTSSLLFQEAWIEEACSRGRGIRVVGYEPEPGERLICGVDFGASLTRGRTAFHVLAVSQKHRKTLIAESGHFKGPDIREKIKQYHALFPNLIVAPEANAQQRLLVELLADALPDVAIIPVTTSRKQYDPGGDIQQIAHEFAEGRWIIANRESPGVQEWLTELLAYQGGHMPDSLAACVFAREVGLRFVERGLAAETPFLPGVAMIAWGDKRSIVRVYLDQKVAILPDDGTEPQFVLGTSHILERYGPWPAPTVVVDFTEVGWDNTGPKRYKAGEILVIDPQLAHAIAEVGERRLSTQLRSWAATALNLAYKAARMLQSSVVDLAEGSSEPTPNENTMTWDRLVELGLPRLSDFFPDADLPLQEDFDGNLF